MNSWFTVKVKYTKQLDNGTFKRVSEPYLLAAMTFTDAEARIYEELGALIRGEFIVTGISRTDIHDISITKIQRSGTSVKFPMKARQTAGKIPNQRKLPRISWCRLIRLRKLMSV